MGINKDLTELVKAGVVTQQTADQIGEYYREKRQQSPGRLFVVFGILGALLIGLGAILIIAHNWDDLPHTIKTSLAFVPMLIGQALCGYSLIKKRGTTWSEGSATFLVFAVGAGIALVGQVYHIPGDFTSFMLTWSALCLPVVYVMHSSMASLLYLIGITLYACGAGYWSFSSSDAGIYWLLLVAVLPHYYWLCRKYPSSNFTSFHHWLVPGSLIISLGTVAHSTEDLMFVAYMSLFGVFSLLGGLPFFSRHPLTGNGYRVLGHLGTIVVLLVLSFDWFWVDLTKRSWVVKEVLTSPEFISASVLSLLAVVLLYHQRTYRSLKDFSLMEIAFFIFILIFGIGLFSPLALVPVNLLILSLGILTIRDGARQEHLGLLNYGLLMIASLVICRFFDDHLSFVFRGASFLVVGAGFFITNYWMLKKRKSNE